MTVFASPGTFTTPASTTKIKVTLVGAGGSGGAAGNPGPTDTSTGGAGGGYAQGIYPVTASTPYPVTIGSGGAAVPSTPGPGVGTAGNSGGTTSFSSLISATGGGGGNVGESAPSNGATGGTGSSGAINIPGGPSSFNARNGGNSMLGFAATALISTQNGLGYGSGGNATPNNFPAPPSGAGADGVVIVEY
jgi:hypothetical protein